VSNIEHGRRGGGDRQYRLHGTDRRRHGQCCDRLSIGRPAGRGRSMRRSFGQARCINGPLPPAGQKRQTPCQR
jgi:hypothetical protein